MDDLRILTEAWRTPAPPSGTAYAQARAAVLERAGLERAGLQRAGLDGTGLDGAVLERAVLERAVLEGTGLEPAAAASRSRRVRRRLRLPRMGVRLVAVGALAVTITAGVTVAQNLGGVDERGRPKPIVPVLPAGPVANAAQALDRAATAAEARTFTPPRPDQWTYLENRETSPSGGPGGVATGGPLKTRVSRQWRRADGKRSAWIEKGRLQIQDEPGRLTPPADYPTLAALPTDPAALLKWVDKEMGGLGGDAPEGHHAMAYTLLTTVLRNSVLPPAVEAAIYRAMKQIPGVTLVPRAVDVAGRPALALGRVQEGWLSEEVLLDRTTYTYLGERSIAIKQHTSKGLDGSWTVKKGTVQLFAARIKAGIVDKAGQRL
ncbi:CU044_5270 family protein [Actinomadura scrupuli]|uniref:CU044_5270 family protein n=1 Tax=Actinomadura scrupuli TaxID=559629 RepID=UPI003D9917DC